MSYKLSFARLPGPDLRIVSGSDESDFDVRPSKQRERVATRLLSRRGDKRLELRTQVRLVRPAYAQVKRCFDIGFSLLVLPLAVAAILFFGLLVWLESPGKIIFVQMRTGIGGRRFRMYKLRTMVHDADKLKVKYAHLNELCWPDFKIANDPRITRIGKFLRKTSLDELPQIFNVLLGDMSWVGPRPTSFAVDTYALWHTERLEVVPGITGLWQISGRCEVEFDERLKMDIEYIEKRNFFFDVVILWKTCFAVFARHGAN